MTQPCIAVAVSGGRDSTALWHATARAAAGTPLRVLALHVHHGLQAEADAWVRHLQAQARRWAARGLPVSLAWRALQGAPTPGDSVEAWARRGRYAALAEMAHAAGAKVVLLAHHREDQAETFLLQALRGAGPAGLAAMPESALREGLVWARPWLDQPRRAIEHYAQRNRLSFIDDPSNADTSLARNRLRHGVWPVLQAQFEHVGTTLGQSARRAHEAAECLRELAMLDAQQACPAPGRLEVAAWLALSTARRGNLLRSWLSEQGEAGAPESLVQRLLHELPEAGPGTAWPAPWGDLRLHAGRLWAVPRTPAQAAPAEPLHIDLSRAGRFAVPAWHGSLLVTEVAAAGLLPDALRHCELRARRGGEQFQRSPRSAPRSLKKQFQAAGVPNWQRDGPLVYGSGRLLYVPGLGIDARALAGDGRPMLAVQWLPDPA